MSRVTVDPSKATGGENVAYSAGQLRAVFESWGEIFYADAERPFNKQAIASHLERCDAALRRVLFEERALDTLLKCVIAPSWHHALTLFASRFQTTQGQIAAAQALLQRSEDKLLWSDALRTLSILLISQATEFDKLERFLYNINEQVNVPATRT